MKLTHWIFVFLAIILPFSIVSRNLINDKFLTMKDEIKLNNILDSATQDASDLIKEIADINSEKNINITPDVAISSINQFFHTLAINFNIPFSSDEDIRTYFESYIPAIIIVGYDGFYVYSSEMQGTTIKHELKPKIPYAYEDTYGNIINFTLDNNVTIYANGVSGKKVFSGEIIDENVISKYNDLVAQLGVSTAEELSNVTNDMSVILYALNKDNFAFETEAFLTSGDPNKDYIYDQYGNLAGEAGSFHKMRRQVITDSIKKALISETSEHNEYAKYLGIAYSFNIPEVSAVEWHNAINDISFLAFIQGIPIGVDTYYNNYALGGSRIITAADIYATDNIRGKRYHTGKCSEVLTGGVIDYNKIDQIFLNNVDAASAGYYPCELCRP
jgi:hypothetical protein